MPQNKPWLSGRIRRNLTAPSVIKAKPGTVLTVLCLQAGTINLINDVTSGGAGLSISGFPATMTAGQSLPLNSSAAVGISAKAVSGAFNVLFT
jgi:hypothetical protein